MKNAPARLLAEFLGVFILVLVGIGAITNDAGLTGIALAFGLAIFVAISAFGHISGGHFNPAVTIALAATKRITTVDAGAYIVAQLIGGATAAAVASMVFGSFAGTAALGDGIDVTTGVIIEVIATFILMIVIMGVAIDSRGSFAILGGLPVAMAVACNVFWAGPATSAAMNPARWFGPALVAGDMSNAVVWIVGPIVGALLAVFAYDLVMKPEPV
jgi:aquaporin Z